MARKFHKNFLAIFLIIAVTCCVPNWYKPFGWRMFRQMPKDGTPGLRLGWLHGCESGLGTQFGGALFMTFYTWKRDADITSANPNVEVIRKRYKKELKGVDWNNPADIKKNFSDYNGIIWTAHAFCRHSLLGTLQSADMTPKIPGQDRYDPTAHSVSNVWRLHGKGDVRIGKSGLW